MVRSRILGAILGLALVAGLGIGVTAAQAAPYDYNTAANHALFWTYVDATPWIQGMQTNCDPQHKPPSQQPGILRATIRWPGTAYGPQVWQFYVKFEGSGVGGSYQGTPCNLVGYARVTVSGDGTTAQGHQTDIYYLGYYGA